MSCHEARRVVLATAQSPSGLGGVHLAQPEMQWPPPCSENAPQRRGAEPGDGRLWGRGLPEPWQRNFREDFL